jgi:hypothetical protein
MELLVVVTDKTKAIALIGIAEVIGGVITMAVGKIKEKRNVIGKTETEVCGMVAVQTAQVQYHPMLQDQQVRLEHAHVLKSLLIYPINLVELMT